jgi:hypothetical protein
VESWILAFGWTSVERVSWLVGIIAAPVGLVFGLRQLAHLTSEQRRATEALLKRPEWMVRFEDVETSDDSLTVEPKWSEGPLSEPVVLKVRSTNVGTASARAAIWNYEISPLLDPNESFGLPDLGTDERTVGAFFSACRLLSDGTLRFVRYFSGYLHPNVSRTETLRATIPIVEEFWIRVRIVALDMPREYEQLLRVEVALPPELRGRTTPTQSEGTNEGTPAAPLGPVHEIVDVVSALARASDLLQAGALTSDEFESIKRQLLHSESPGQGADGT